VPEVAIPVVVAVVVGIGIANATPVFPGQHMDAMWDAKADQMIERMNPAPGPSPAAVLATDTSNPAGLTRDDVDRADAARLGLLRPGETTVATTVSTEAATFAAENLAAGITNIMMSRSGRGGGSKGERGHAAKPEGTNNPGKKMRPDPNDPTKVIYTDPQTGKKISTPKPPDAK
jgi:hypothetical protein